MKIAELKIKIASLAAESRLIRRAETRHRSRARACERFARDAEHAITAAQADLARVNEGVDPRDAVASKMVLDPRDAVASKMVLRMASHVVANVGHAVAGGPAARSTFWSLRNHRTGVVRAETRHALLAYTLMRGRPYSYAEAGNSSEPDWYQVKFIAERFGVALPAISLWIVEAKAFRQDYVDHLYDRLAHVTELAAQG